MRVVCTANAGSSLSADHFKKNYASPASQFDVEPGKEYIVYGISLFKGFLLYLVLGEGLYPQWYPSELFRVTLNELPPEWYFACFPKDFDLKAIWGYEELANATDYFDSLSNLEKPAIEVFLDRKKQIDEVS